jgi:cytochrome c-type biogenesis protein
MIAAFIAGLLSFLSPCVLPLVPGYISLISGASVDELRSPDRKILKTVMLHSIMFILGFTIVFVTLGAAASSLGQLVQSYKRYLTWAAGIVIIVFGIHLTGIVKIKALYADKRLHSLQGGKSPVGAFLVGFAFAFGWTPCIGPFLGSVMSMAASSDTLGTGILLLTVYSLGLAVPFLLISVAFDRFLVFYGQFRRYLPAVEVGGGVLLILIGVLVLTGHLALLSAWLGSHDNATKVLNVVLLLIIAVGLILTGYLIFTRAPGWMSKLGHSLKDKKTSGIALAALVLVVAGGLFIGKSLLPRSVPANERDPAATPAARQDRFIGNPAPDFELKVLDTAGKTLKLSDFKGKAVLVNFWATWCEPCKVEMPWLVDLQKKYGPDGFQIVGIAMDDTDEKTIASFARKMGINYPIVIGTEKVADLYGGIDGMPTLFFVDRGGKIVDHELGLRSMDLIESNVKKSLGEGGASNTASAPAASNTGLTR